MSKWSQFYFVPGMSHCGGGQALDQFDLLGAMVSWVEKGGNSHISRRYWQGLSGAQPATVSLSEACSLQGARRYGRRSQLRVPLNFVTSASKNITSMRLLLVIFTVIVMAITVPIMTRQKVEL